MTVFAASAAAAQTAVVTVSAPASVSTFIGHDAKVVVSATTTGTGSSPALVYTPLAKNMHIRQLTTGQTSTWQVSWTPRPGHDGDDTFVCFQAVDNLYATQSFGQACTAWNVTPAQVLGLTGIVRTFNAAHPDMSRPLNEDASPSPNFVAQTLGADSKPVFTSAAAGITHFNEWFNDVPSVNQASTYSVYLSNGGQLDPSLYNFQSANWQPVDGQRYFTYEAHGSLTYSPGLHLTFKSSDDLWVFINGALIPGASLQGVHAERTQTIDFDMLGLIAGGSYPIDIFYAHRGATTTPSIQLQLGPAPAIPSLGPTVTTIDAGEFIPAALSTLGAAQTNSSELQLLPANGDTNDAAAAWLTSGFNLRNGFDLEFTYVGSPAAAGEGFAAVIAAAPGLGEGGGGLGYSGLPRSLAVEFDARQSSALDPSYQHIAAHTLGLNANSSQIVAAVGVQPYDPGLPTNFFNASPQRVRVSYTPTVAQPFGWIRVWMNDNILPSLETMLSQADFGKLLDEGRAFLGFTSGRGNDSSSLNITSIRMTTTVNLAPHPVDPLQFRFVEGTDTSGGGIAVVDPENDHVQAWVSGTLPPGVTTSFGTQGAPILFQGAPLPGSRGSYPVILNMTDGANTVATPFVIVVNHPPIAVNDAITLATPTRVTFDPRVNDADEDNDLLRILSVSTPQSGVVEILADGTLRYTSSSVGTDSFTYTIGDWWETATATVTVITLPEPAPEQIPGVMHGSGSVESGGRIYDFDVRVAERKLGRERGWIDIDIKTPKTAKKKELVDRFESTDVTDIKFWDDPAFRPSRQKKPRPIADSVLFSGAGKWNGAKGYRFEVKLTDQGEPGRGHDRLTLTIYNAAGAAVATVDDVLDGGNIQSERLQARYWR